MRKRRKERGMSLVEVAASGVAVAVSLIGASASVISSVQLNQGTNRVRDSARAAESLIEEVRNADFDDLVTDYSGTIHHVVGGDATISVTDVTSNNLTQWKVYRVQIDVTYHETVADGTLTFVSFITDRDQGSSLAGVPETPADGVEN